MKWKWLNWQAFQPFSEWWFSKCVTPPSMSMLIVTYLVYKFLLGKTMRMRTKPNEKKKFPIIQTNWNLPHLWHWSRSVWSSTHKVHHSTNQNWTFQHTALCPGGSLVLRYSSFWSRPLLVGRSFCPPTTNSSCPNHCTYRSRQPETMNPFKTCKVLFTPLFCNWHLKCFEAAKDICRVFLLMHSDLFQPAKEVTWDQEICLCNLKWLFYLFLKCYCTFTEWNGFKWKKTHDDLKENKH